MNKVTNELLEKIKQCSQCSSIIGHKKFPIKSHGNYASKYLLVSEAPGKESLDRNLFWVGVGGQILRTCAADAGTSLEELFYMTDIVKCWPNINNSNRPPTEAEIKACSNYLVQEIEELRPKLILAFGKHSASFLLKRNVKMKHEHGTVHELNDDTKVLVMLHPTGIDRQMNRIQYFRQLTLVFEKLRQSKHNEIANIFL